MKARVKQMGGMEKRDHEQFLAGYRLGYTDRDSEVGEEMQQLRQQVSRLEDTVNRLSQPQTSVLRRQIDSAMGLSPGQELRGWTMAVAKSHQTRTRRTSKTLLLRQSDAENVKGIRPLDAVHA